MEKANQSVERGKQVHTRQISALRIRNKYVKFKLEFEHSKKVRQGQFCALRTAKKYVE